MPQDRQQHDLHQDDDTAAYHYSVVKRAIDVIDAQDETLTLEALAGKMHMSPAHFQRVFSKWVGVSPKRYQQYLTLGHAKALLDANFTTLGTADAVGLSGAGRLHDLFVRWEAMSPGEFALKGAGLTIRYGYAPSPFGEVLIMATDRGICGMGFTSEMGQETCYADLARRWPEARYSRDDSNAARLASGVFEGTPTHLHLIGAPFQIKVWEALLSIPSGQVSTYSEIAGHIGNPKAVRAVGTAVGRNPISWLVPCHRALRKSGGLGGYHWGLPVKRAMLAYEGARADVMREAS